MASDPLLNFRCPLSTVAELDRIAHARGITRSELVREAVALVLEQHPDQQQTAA